jgi:uncharacterized protein (DUF4415 family)
MTTDFARERRLRDLDEEMREAIQATDKQRTIAALEGRLTMEKRGRGRPRKDTATIQVAIRLDPETVARIDLYADQLRTEIPGVTVTRSAAIRALILQALTAV